MIVQDIDLPIQKQHIVSTQAADGIYIHVQESEAILTEEKSAMDHVDENIDTTSANILAKDPIIYNVFPPITTLHGISVSLSSRILPDFYRSHSFAVLPCVLVFFLVTTCVLLDSLSNALQIWNQIQ